MNFFFIIFWPYSHCLLYFLFFYGSLMAYWLFLGQFYVKVFQRLQKRAVFSGTGGWGATVMEEPLLRTHFTVAAFGLMRLKGSTLQMIALNVTPFNLTDKASYHHYRNNSNVGREKFWFGIADSEVKTDRDLKLSV